jgi:hypothetical protein
MVKMALHAVRSAPVECSPKKRVRAGRRRVSVFSLLGAFGVRP